MPPCIPLMRQAFGVVESFSHHIFDSTDELVVEEQVLGLIFRVGSRVEHPAHTAGHCTKMLLSCILPAQKPQIFKHSAMFFICCKTLLAV